MGDIGPVRNRYEVLAATGLSAALARPDGRMPDPEPMPVPDPEPIPDPSAPTPEPEPVPQPPSGG